MARLMLCLRCQRLAPPRRFLSGSDTSETVLWLIGLIGGLSEWLPLVVLGPAYSLWRRFSSYVGCPHCQQPGMVRQDSPRALRILQVRRGPPWAH
jgi:hypothetical protein